MLKQVVTGLFLFVGRVRKLWMELSAIEFREARTMLKKRTDFLTALSQRKNNFLRRCDHG